MRSASPPRRPGRLSLLDSAFAAGSTALFLVMMASVAGAVTLYMR